MAQDIKVHRGVITIPAGGTTASATVTLHDTASSVLSDGHVFVRRMSSGCGSPVFNPTTPTTLQQVFGGQPFLSRVSLSAGAGTTLNITANAHAAAGLQHLVAWEAWEYVGEPGGPNEFQALADESAVIQNNNSASFPTLYPESNEEQYRKFQAIVPMPLGEMLDSGAPNIFQENTTVYRFVKATVFGNGFFQAGRESAVNTLPLRVHMTPVAFVGAAWYTNYFLITPSASGGLGAFDDLDDNVDWSHTLPLNVHKRSPQTTPADFGAAIDANDPIREFTFAGPNGLPQTEDRQVALSDHDVNAAANGQLTGFLLSNGNMHVTHKRSSTYGADLTQVAAVTTNTASLGVDPTAQAAGGSDFSDFATSYGFMPSSTTFSCGSHLMNPTIVDNGTDISVQVHRTMRDLNNVSALTSFWVHLATFRSDGYEVTAPNTLTYDGDSETDHSVQFRVAGSAGKVSADPSLIFRDGSAVYEAYPLNAEPAILSLVDVGITYSNPTAGNVQLRKLYSPTFSASDVSHIRLVMQRADNQVLTELALVWRRTTDTQDFVYSTAVAQNRVLDLDPDYFKGSMKSLLFDMSEYPAWSGDINAIFLHSQGASGNQGARFFLDSWRLLDSAPSEMEANLNLDADPVLPRVATASLTNANAISAAPFAPRYAQAAMTLALDVDATATVVVPDVFDPDLSLEGLQVVSQEVSATKVLSQGILARLTAQVQTQATLEADETLTAALTTSQSMDAKE